MNPSILRTLGWLAGLTCVMMTGISAVQVQHKATTTVLAAHPLVTSLAETLTAGTRIKVVHVAPANLPYTRWHNYLTGRGAAALARDAALADATLTLRSLWPDDPLYTLARRTNIRIVEIGSARPVDGTLPGIALHAALPRSPSPLLTQPWLDPANLGRMADIMATDLQRLTPDESAILARHLATFKQRLVTFSAQAETALAQAPNLSVIVLSDRLDYLTAALNLDVVPFLHHGDDWDAAAIQSLATAVRDNDIAAILHHETLPQAVQHAIRAAKPGTALLDLKPVTKVGDVEETLQHVVRTLSTSQSASLVL